MKLENNTEVIQNEMVKDAKDVLIDPSEHTDPMQDNAVFITSDIKEEASAMSTSKNMPLETGTKETEGGLEAVQGESDTGKEARPFSDEAPHGNEARSYESSMPEKEPIPYEANTNEIEACTSQINTFQNDTADMSYGIEGVFQEGASLDAVDNGRNARLIGKEACAFGKHVSEFGKEASESRKEASAYDSDCTQQDMLIPDMYSRDRVQFYLDYQMSHDKMNNDINPHKPCLSDSIQNSPYRIFPKSMDLAIRKNGGETDSPRHCLSEDEVQFLRGIPDGACNGVIAPIPPPPRAKKSVMIAEPSTYQTLTIGNVNGDDDEEFTKFQQYNSKDCSPDVDYFVYDTVSSTSSTTYMLRKAAQEKRQGTPNTEEDLQDAASCSTFSSTSSTAMLLKKDDKDIPRTRLHTTEDKEYTKVTEEAGLMDGEYVDLVQSGCTGKALLAATLDQVRKSLEDLSTPVAHPLCPSIEKMHKIKNTYIKNLIVLSIGFMLVYTAFFSLRNLQSSINHDNGLGLLSLSIMYSTYLVGCLFAPMIIQHCRPKWAIIAPMIPMTLFTLANFYPTYYTLLPTTALLGFGNANIWTAQGTYITSIAVSYAVATGKNHSCILGIFNGFFLFLVQLAQLFGNLITSTIFSIEMSDYQESQSYQNETIAPDLGICGSRYCHVYNIDHASVNVQKHMIYILLGVFTGFIIAGGLLLLILLDRLDVIFVRQKRNFRQQLLALFHLHTDLRLVFLIPFLTFLGLEEAFIFGEFTKAYITCPLGLHMIGYVMMVFGGVDAVACFMFGNLQKCLSRLAIVLIGILCYTGVLIYMYLWTPSADIWSAFLIAAGLGIGDAAWQSQSSSITGELFPHNREAAFASLRMYEAVGFVVACGYAQYLCMDVKIYVMGCLLILVFFTYCIMEILHKKCYQKNSVCHPERV